MLKQLHLLSLILLSSCLLTSVSTLANPDASNSSQQEDITRFIKTVDIIKHDYAKNINDKTLLENAIRGMVNNLDPHSEYLDENAYKSLLMSTSGEFGGLGIEIISEYGVLKVVTPLNDTPAAKAGIKTGDYIVALDGKSVNDMSLNEALEAMRGEKGTQVALTIIRKGEKNPLQFHITRDTIHLENIQSKLFDNAYGYIRIDQFEIPTNNLLINAINTLNQKAGGQMKGLILDLRNNPGGLLNSAISVADTFLDSDKLDKYKKLIVYTEGREPHSQYQATASGHDLLKSAPLIVLINEGSASASEIVAGALQDYHRAIIVGTTSFGKGSVQTILPLDSTHAIKLTTALYFTPAGRMIQNQGIIPDVMVANIKVENNHDDNLIDGFKESSLKNHIMSEEKNTSSTTGETKKMTSLAQDDFQLYESLNMLKALSQQQSASNITH